VAQQLLDDARIGSVLEHVRCPRVAEQMTASTSVLFVRSIRLPLTQRRGRDGAAGNGEAEPKSSGRPVPLAAKGAARRSKAKWRGVSQPQARPMVTRPLTELGRMSLAL